MTTADLPRTYPPGVPSWVDTEQPDVGAALDCHGGLFGWHFAEPVLLARALALQQVRDAARGPGPLCHRLARRA